MWRLLLCCLLGTLGHGIGLVQDNFLIVASYRTLYQLDLDTESTVKIHEDPGGYIWKVVFDPVEKKIYWKNKRYIRRANLNETGFETIYEGNFNSFDVDPVSRLVYYTTHRGTNVMTLDGRHHFMITSRRGANIALHGLMFLDDVGMTFMDGTQHTTMKTNGYYTVRSLTVDQEGDRLYWRAQDRNYYGIHSVSLLNSSEVRVLLQTRSPVGGLAPVGDILFYSDENVVAKINVSESTPTRQVVGELLIYDVFSVVAYSTEHFMLGSTSTHPCSHLNGGCEHICLPTPHGPRCACPDGFNIVNGTRCSIATYECSREVITARRGRIRSPGFPGYRNNVQCDMTIQMKGFKRVFLFVEEFDLGKNDFLLQVKGVLTHEMNLHDMLNSTVQPDSNEQDVYLKFVSDTSVTKMGFSIIYELHQVTYCGINPCQHRGTCVREEFCVCHANYTGAQCENDEHDPCRSLPCQNGGWCENKRTGYACICRQVTTGHLCQTDNHCASLTCRNGGSCIRVPAGVMCDCKPGFTGDHCQIDIDECLSNPCQNDANCSTPQADMFSCDCVAGYTGVNCETDIDECAISQCQNGARCSTSQLDVYSCDCLAGYTGHNCEIDLDTCRSHPCQNAGTCRNLTDAFQCVCVTGFMGYVCENDTNTCRSDPCLNGGTCRDWFNGYHCQCVDGFSGDICGKQSKQGTFSPSMLFVAGALGGALLIGVVIGAIVGVITCRRRRQQPVDKDAAREMSGQTIQHIQTEDKTVSTTNLNVVNNQEYETPVADFAAEQRNYARIHHGHQ